MFRPISKKPAQEEGYCGRVNRRLFLIVLMLCVLALTSTSMGAAGTRLPGFRSPSGNIRCLFLPPGRDDTGHPLPSQLQCSIAQADYAEKLQARCMAPSRAGVDWHGWSLSPTGKGMIVCSGGILYNPDTQRPSYGTLPYGESWRQAVFTCWSRVTGVSCRSRHGHGLLISRQAWRAW